MTTLTHSPDNEEALDPGAEVAQFEAEVAKLGDITVETEAHANALVNREIELRKRLDLQRIAEVAPHIEGQRTVNGFYNPLIARCQEAVRSVRQKINAFIEAERARREAEARVAYEAAIAAEEAAVEAEDPFDEFEKTEAAKKAAIAARDTHLAAKRPVAVRGGGRTVAQKTSYYVHLDGDGGDLVGHFASHEDVIEMCRAKAEKIVRAAKGNPSGIPGIRVETRRGV